MSGSGRALFLDRDGVINRDRGYVHRIEDFEFVDGIFELARSAGVRGYRIIVVTNQAGIGRGYYSEADFSVLTAWMRDRFREHGAVIDGVYHCPDHPEFGIGRYRRDSPLRKPNPGMILAAARDLGIDVASSALIGDKETDIEAGVRAGVGTLILLAATGAPPAPTRAHAVIRNLQEAIGLLSGPGSMRGGDPRATGR